MHTVKHLRFIEALAATQVEPTVVMQESTVRMSPLFFDVSKKVAPQLAGSGHSNHRGIGNRLARTQRQYAREHGRRSIAFHLTRRKRGLEAEEKIARHDRRSGNLPHDSRTGNIKIEEPHFGNIDGMR